METVLVPPAGLEPARARCPRDFKSHASTVPPRRHARRTIGAAVVSLQALPDSLHILRGSRLTPLAPQNNGVLCFSRHPEVRGAPSSGLPEPSRLAWLGFTRARQYL